MAHFLSKLLRKLCLATHREWAWSFWAANTDLLLASYHGEVVWSFCVSLCTYSLSFKLYFWPLNCARLVVRCILHGTIPSIRCHSIFPPPDIFSSGANGLRIWPPPGLVALGRKLRPWGESSVLMRRGISAAVMSPTIKGGCEMGLLTQLHFHDGYSRRI